MNQHPGIKIQRKKKQQKPSNALQNELTMFADQIDTVAVVIYLSRPQMAILDFDEQSVCDLRGKKRDHGSLAHEAQEGTRRQPQRTMTQQGYNGTRPAYD